MNSSSIKKRFDSILGKKNKKSRLLKKFTMITAAIGVIGVGIATNESVSSATALFFLNGGESHKYHGYGKHRRNGSSSRQFGWVVARSTSHENTMQLFINKPQPWGLAGLARNADVSPEMLNTIYAKALEFTHVKEKDNDRMVIESDELEDIIINLAGNPNIDESMISLISDSTNPDILISLLENDKIQIPQLDLNKIKKNSSDQTILALAKSVENDNAIKIRSALFSDENLINNSSSLAVNKR